ncbi:hypothetical protein D3C73_1614770 [compost metagenome]
MLLPQAVEPCLSDGDLAVQLRFRWFFLEEQTSNCGQSAFDHVGHAVLMISKGVSGKYGHRSVSLWIR